jgi:Fe-S-cluster containining protein
LASCWRPYMTRFDCLRCGKCCISFIDRLCDVPTGLALFPDEVNLFDQADIRPLIGVARGTAIVPVWYQLIRAPCPYYEPERCACTVYARRPCLCRAYPFKLALSYTKLGRCTWLTEQPRKGQIALSAEMIVANETIAAYDRATFSLVSPEQVWVFNFETDAWVPLHDLRKSGAAMS